MDSHTDPHFNADVQQAVHQLMSHEFGEGVTISRPYTAQWYRPAQDRSLALQVVTTYGSGVATRTEAVEFVVRFHDDGRVREAYALSRGGRLVGQQAGGHQLVKTVVRLEILSWAGPLAPALLSDVEDLGREIRKGHVLGRAETLLQSAMTRQQMAAAALAIGATPAQLGLDGESAPSDTHADRWLEDSMLEASLDSSDRYEQGVRDALTSMGLALIASGVSAATITESWQTVIDAVGNNTH